MKFSRGAILTAVLVSSCSAWTVQRNTMSMRLGTFDMARRQKFNRILGEAGHDPESIKAVVLTDRTSSLIQKCNWKLRKAMLRKVTSLAAVADEELPDGFGVPPTQTEREAMEQVASTEYQANRRAAVAAAASAVQDRKAAREAAKADRAARQAAAPPKKKKAPKAAAAPATPKKEAPKAAAPDPAAAKKKDPAPAAAPASAGGEITPKTIKQLRDTTGAGMMDCKKALTECNGDQEEAADFLRKKGLAQADKKASRVAAEGKIVYSTSGSKAVLVEVNCETDFVAKDGSFQAFADNVAKAALDIEGDNVDALMDADIGGESIEAARQALVSKIGENIQVRRFAGRGGDDNVVGAYVHMNRIGVLVELEGGSETLAADVAMHVAAMNPPYAVPADVPQDVLEKEKKLLSEQALETGKPPEIVEKMVGGRIRKYLEEICLVSQTYVKTNDKTVGKLLEENGAKMVGFTRIEVGEGIEKKSDDFAAEVAAMAGGN